MVPGGVTFLTLEVIASHVDIAVAIRVQKLTGKVGMLDSLLASAVEMTFTGLLNTARGSGRFTRPLNCSATMGINSM
jgi:hypothetical protein